MGKPEYEKKYEEGKRIEKANVIKARDCYNEASHIGKLAIARLYFDKKLSPDDSENPTELQYIETALDKLYEIKFESIPNKHLDHPELKAIRKYLQQIIRSANNYSNRIRAKAYYLLATWQKNININKYIIYASWYGERKALDELIRKKVENKFHIDEVRTILAMFIEFKNKNVTLETYQAYVYYLLINMVMNANKAKDELLKITAFIDDNMKEEINLIKNYDFSLLTDDVLAAAKLTAMNPFSLTSVVDILSFLSEKNALYEEDILKNITDYLLNFTDKELSAVLNPKAAYHICRLGLFYKEADKMKALKLLRQGIDKLNKDHTEFESFDGHYKQVLQETGYSEDLNKAQTYPIQLSNSQEQLMKAEIVFSQWKTTKNIALLKQAVEIWKTLALNKNIAAINKIHELHQLYNFETKVKKSRKNSISETELTEAEFNKKNTVKIPEFPAVLAEILQKFPTDFFKTIPGVLPERKKSEIYAEEMYRLARDGYEELLKKYDKGQDKNRSDIHYEVAKLRYTGKVFQQNWHLARLLFEKAANQGNAEAFYYCAKMYFYGEGGEAKLQKAKDYISRSEYNPENNIEKNYLKAEIHYIDYLYAIDAKDEQKKTQALQICLNIYYENILQDHRASLLSLFAIYKYDKELSAAESLAKIYVEFFAKLPLLQTVKFSELGEYPNDYGTLLYKYLLENCKDINIGDTHIIQQVENYRARLADQDEKNKDQLSDLIEKYKQAEASNDVLDLQLLAQQLKPLAESGYQEAIFYFAKYQLSKNDPLPMRKLAGTGYHQPARDLLFDYYKNTPDGVFKILTTLCYEANRHVDTKVNKVRYYPQCCLLIEVLEKLNSIYEKYEKEDFVRDLVVEESKQNTYFDEYVSDDSDGETEKTYQASNKQHTADQPRTKTLINKIAPEAETKLKELLKAKIIDDDKYKQQVDKIKALFLNSIDVSIDAAYDARVAEDLATVNHYSAQGQLSEGLRLVSTKFVLIQKRGLHFKINGWNQQQRRKYWGYIKDAIHPLHDKATFSFAVYKRAGIDDFTDISELAYLRLEKVARYMHQRMMNLHTKPPYIEDDIVLPESYKQYQFNSRNDQMQQLYSNEYDLFHTFLKSEIKNSDSIFLNDMNPLVSTADIQSSHSERYAYGIKPYAGHEHERLRPRYDGKTGRAIRPHSGAVLLTMHPLSDYARNDHNHIVSMCMLNKIIIDQRIIPERECSFYSFVEQGRLFFIHKAKYPSFNHAKRPKFFLHDYGINDELYRLFKEIITNTNPHDNKQRLAILLLGEYLAMYHTLYLLRYSHEKAKEKNYVPLYRDKYGNFSLKPTSDISPTPAGDDERYRLRRYYTHENRLLLFKTETNRTSTTQVQADLSSIGADEELLAGIDRMNVVNLDNEKQKSTDTIVTMDDVAAVANPGKSTKESEKTYLNEINVQKKRKSDQLLEDLPHKRAKTKENSAVVLPGVTLTEPDDENNQNASQLTFTNKSI